MKPWDLSYLVSQAAFTLGALAFCVLTASYWTQRRHRPDSAQFGVFPAFTLLCALAFLNNLLYQVVPWALPILLRNLIAGILPVVMAQVIWESVSAGLSGRRLWRGILAGLYAVGFTSTLARGLNESGLVSTPGIDALYSAPAAVLVAASAAGLILLAVSHWPLRAGKRAYHRWMTALLALFLLCAVANLAGVAALAEVPDYLLLAFFSVNLYYKERLVFIDLLLKRGVFLALGLLILAGFLAVIEPASSYGLGLLTLALWIVGPWVYARLSAAIDSIWLRRSYSAPEAERMFIRDIQAATSEDELRSSASRSLSAIFATAAEVRFGPSSADESYAPDNEALSIKLGNDGPVGSSVMLATRANGIPFLSEDRSLAESLARALDVVWENVRFREERHRQQEREQQLRWLASGAELKALRAQINPHFLFNALSAITGLIQYQPELASETIEQLAQVFRYALRKSENEWSLLAEEVEFVAAYLRVEQARFGKGLCVRFDVDPDAVGVPIPAMSIQPLIENAIKHGVSSGREGIGVVRLRAEIERGVLVVEVFDSGPGFPAGFSLETSAEGRGLRNVADRLRGYYGDAARLTWESGPGATRVALSLPQAGITSAAEVRCQ